MQGIASRLVLAAVVGALGGCGLLGGGERTPASVYLLAVERGDAPAAGGACGTLEIHEPAPAAGFASARMLYQREPHRLEPFAYARWAESPASMVKEALVIALESSGLFSAVLPAPAPVPADVSLAGDMLRVLQRFDGGASVLEVGLDVRIVDLRDARLVASRRVERRVQASPDPAGGVASANRALAEVVAEVIELVRSGLDCAGAAQPAD
jgi:cholesterol transport system auxiliary component